MADELRAALPRAFERLADDLLIGRHADPHVAFAVLVYPDRHPAIIAITPRQSGVHDITTLVTRDDEQADDVDDGKGRFFTVADLEDAGRAIDDTLMGMRLYRYQDRKMQLGPWLLDRIAGGYDSRRGRALEAAMKKAAHEAKYAFKCDICGSGYTERGLKMHQARSVYCSRRLAERAMDGAKEAEHEGP